MKAVQERTELRRVVATNSKEHLPPHLRLLFTLLLEKKQGHRVRLRDGDCRLKDLYRRGAAAPTETRPAPDDLAAIMMSGGTTGTPKGVVAPHRGLLCAALQLRAWYRPASPQGGDTLLLPLPLFHSYGSAAALPFALLSRNAIALVPNPRDLGDLLRTIRRVQPTMFLGVPTLFSALTNHPAVRNGRADLRSVRAWLSAAAPLLAENKRRFEEASGGRILEGYSLSEALIAAVINPFGGVNKPGSVGLPLPDVELRVVDAEEGVRPCRAGETGEILLRAPQIMPGYWRREAETAETLRRHDDGTPWLHTGDLGYLDEDGYLFLVDRKKELIKPGGLQVWPREVEEALAAHPAVAEVGVAGVMDAERGEVVKAWVVLRAGAQATAEELRAWCKQRLAPFKVPAQIAFRQELPKSLVGKVLRRVLVEQDRAVPA